MRSLMILTSALVASAFVSTPLTAFAYKTGTKQCATAAEDVGTELERVKKENEDLKELKRLQDENEQMRGSLALPKSRFFDRFFGLPEEAPSGKSALSLIEEMDEILQSSTSLLGGVMKSMLSAEPFQIGPESKEAIDKVLDEVKASLEKNGELSSKVVCDPPASQSYHKTVVNGKEQTDVSLLLRAHAEGDTNRSGIVRCHATIDDEGNVDVDRLELNKNLLIKQGDKQLLTS